MGGKAGIFTHFLTRLGCLGMPRDGLLPQTSSCLGGLPEASIDIVVSKCCTCLAVRGLA